MIKYFRSSSNSVLFLQLLSFVIIITHLFIIEFSWHYLILSILFFYIYNIIGIGMMLHRYYSHKSFKLNKILEFLLTILAIMTGRGSTIGWVYVHRIHHATADTEKDPHSPYHNFKFIGFKTNTDETKKINYFIVKDLLTPLHIKIDKYYLLIIFLILTFLYIINYNYVFYIWALPVFSVSVSQILFNYFAHKTGYRNFETKDRSTNNFYLWPFILGDAWHNNHHAAPHKLTTKVKFYEFDPVSVLINIVKK